MHIYHHGIKCSPYEAVFGQPMKCGLKTSNLLDEVVSNISTEEELEALITAAATESSNEDDKQTINMQPTSDESKIEPLSSSHQADHEPASDIADETHVEPLSSSHQADHESEAQGVENSYKKMCSYFSRIVNDR